MCIRDRRKGSFTVLDDTPWPTRDQAIALEVKAGSIVVFHDHIPHRSDVNLSTNSRVAVTFHGYHPDSTWLHENWLHRKHLPDFLIESKGLT